MNHENEQDRAHSHAAATTAASAQRAAAPGQLSRSALLHKPDQAIASGLVPSSRAQIRARPVENGAPQAAELEIAAFDADGNEVAASAAEPAGAPSPDGGAAGQGAALDGGQGAGGQGAAQTGGQGAAQTGAQQTSTGSGAASGGAGGNAAATTPAPAAAPALVIRGPRELWFFDGQTPAGYPVSAPLSSNATGGTFAWSASAQLTLSSATAARPTVTTAAASTGLRDAWIRLRHTDASGTTTAASYRLTVLAPASMTPTGNTNNPITRGWESFVGYSIQDQFGTTLPRNVPINESWTDKPPIGDFPGTNWPSFPPTEGGVIVNPAGWRDHLLMADGVPAVLVPTPGSPGTGGPQVEHFAGTWQVGSTTIGSGRRVRTVTWRFFQDHGDHA